MLITHLDVTRWDQVQLGVVGFDIFLLGGGYK